ncbi:MAG: hypothetical protein IJC15_08730 [Clostridia bacterium]|nr:hypothetical protein [Clostridia bacterium]
MSASSRECGRIAFTYLCAAIGTAAAGFIYEQFSHGVWSAAMVYAFAIPLCGGALPFAALALWGGQSPRPFARVCWHLGLATLTVGSLFSGVLAIYGTTNRLIAVYPIAGGLLCAAAAVSILLAKSTKT